VETLRYRVEFGTGCGLFPAFAYTQCVLSFGEQHYPAVSRIVEWASAKYRAKFYAEQLAKVRFAFCNFQSKGRKHMNINGNTILVTGGGSGIGRGLAEAFLKAGNQVVIAGRRREALQEATAANPGMKAVVLDIENPKSIRTVASQMASEFPALNVVINNAGIMRPENLKAPPQELVDAEAMVTTNLLGPIRLTGALLPLLRSQPVCYWESVIRTATSSREPRNLVAEKLICSS
jgi:NADPH:quinone reductase-like Zn-dependent oxidoreductase